MIEENTNKKSNIWVRLIITIVLIVFISIPVYISISEISKFANNYGIAKHGKQTMATVVSYEVGMTAMNNPYYYVEYEFLDEEGNKHTGKTSPAYTIQQVNDLIGNGVLICYDANYNSIQADYHFTFNGNAIIIILFPSVFILFVILIFIALNQKKGKESWQGTDTERKPSQKYSQSRKIKAEIISIEPLESNGEVFGYQIKARYQTQNGETVERYLVHDFGSDSNALFLPEHAEYLKKNKEISVYVNQDEATPIYDELINNEEIYTTRVAEFISADLVNVINNQKCYTVKVKYMDKDGLITQEDIYNNYDGGDKAYFAEKDVNKLQQMHKFKVFISYKNFPQLDEEGIDSIDVKKSNLENRDENLSKEIIFGNYDSEEKKKSKTQKYGTLASSNVLRCLRCGDVVPPGKTKCPTCGSKKFDNIIE